MSLADFWTCSLWEFSAAVAGWNRSQSGDEPSKGMTPETYEKLLAKHGYRNG